MGGAAASVQHRAASTEDSDTQGFIGWTLERFAHQRMVLTTQFGMEGCALIDMYAEYRQPLSVIYLDTMFLFAETYALRDRMARRYPHLSFENRGTRVTPEQQAEQHGEALWSRNPDLCCRIRKVEPMRNALTGVDVWITGITRGQSHTRADTPLIEWDRQFNLVKISPLAQWDRQRVWDYVREHDVPYNPLHERGYPSIGCTHCTIPVAGASVTEYTRLGRWSGSNKAECGLHGTVST